MRDAYSIPCRSRENRSLEVQMEANGCSVFNFRVVVYVY